MPAAPTARSPASEAGVSLLRRDIGVTLLGLALLLAWDASGADLALVRLFGTDQGFAWRDNWWASTLAHDGGRLLGWCVLAGMALAAARQPGPPAAGSPGRAERWKCFGVVVLCLLAVPALKRFSATSCPWDLAQFGGVARYVSHWQWGEADGGPGRCFPSGHAVAAFAFFGLHFMWRSHDRRRARAWQWAVVAAGLVFGAAQLMRGAHYASHTLWSAWLCWLICVVASHLPAWRMALPRTAPQSR